MDNRSLVVQQPQSTAIEQAGAPAELVKLAAFEPELAQRAMAIILSRPVDQYNPPLQPARAIAAVLYERQTGQVCGRDFFADNRMGIVPGYRGRMKEAADRNVSDYIDDYRPMRADELAEHEIKAGDSAKICELTVIARHKACREAGIPFKPIIGIGIVRASEKVNREGKPIPMNGGYTWDRKARNRALKDALSHAGFAKNAAEVVEDAHLAGYDLGMNDDTLAKLNREQAVYVVETAQRKEKQAYQQAEAQAAEILQAVGATPHEDTSDLFPIEDAAPEPLPPHWSDDADLTARMYKYAAKYGLSEAETLALLGVDTLRHFDGTAKDAAHAINAFVLQREEQPE